MSKRRLSNVSYESESESDSNSESLYSQPKTRKINGDEYNIENLTPQERTRKPTRLPKVYSRNAVMARQNRIKKKKYMEDLENQVEVLKSQLKVLKTVTNNQSRALMDHKKEIKYLKNVLSNQSTISKLLRPIQDNLKGLQSEEFNRNIYPDFPSPESAEEFANCDDFLQEIPYGNITSVDLPNPANFNISDDSFPIFDENTVKKHSKALEEHNYTSNSKLETDSDSDENVGVCLHISKQKISLEFCNLCNDRANMETSEEYR